ncbi:MAG TPA: alkaline phosphatase PhoX [Mycobacteriales bacterium]|nr:alkaline phosphatase PhoX [Mycobacteriales bacterium]
MTELNRRTFLRGAAVTGGLAAAGPFEGLLAQGAHAAGPQGPSVRRAGYGALRPVTDLRDGAVRLHLPAGFQYRSFSVGLVDQLVGGGVVPNRQDGMEAFQARRGRVRLVRNHEVNGPGTPLPHVAPYDSAAQGGTTTVEVNRDGTGAVTWVSCSGTQMNCSGGEMPWGSWVTAEETVNGPDVGPDFTGTPNTALTQPHGYIYEVPAWEGPSQVSRRVPIRSAGRFAHESVSLDPRTGALYETEDNFNFPSGFYRYDAPVDPRRAKRIVDGGRLWMLKVKGVDNADLSGHFANGTTFRTEWVRIADPDPTMPAGTTNDQAIVAVGNQGRAQGAAWFSRLEGVIYSRGKHYFTSTQGGAAVPPPGQNPPAGFGDGYGQVWAYDPKRETLTMVYESPSKALLDLPDNLTISPRGSILLCEDGSVDNYLRGLTRDGFRFDFAKNAIAGKEGEEFAGATFAPNGRTLFVNIQASSSSMSFAIWGPWQRGAL